MTRQTATLELDYEALLLHATALETEERRLAALKNASQAAGLPDLVSDYAELIQLTRAQLALVRHAMRQLHLARIAH